MNAHRLWKDNKIDQEYSIGRDELIAKFRVWLSTKDRAYIDYHNYDTLIRLFLNGQEGMNSVFEESDFVALYEDLKPAIVEHLRATA